MVIWSTVATAREGYMSSQASYTSVSLLKFTGESRFTAMTAGASPESSMKAVLLWRKSITRSVRLVETVTLSTVRKMKVFCTSVPSRLQERSTLCWSPATEVLWSTQYRRCCL